MIGARRLIRDLAHDLAEAQVQAWNALTEMDRLLAENNELRDQVVVLEAIIVEQEKELACHA